MRTKPCAMQHRPTVSGIWPRRAACIEPVPAQGQPRQVQDSGAGIGNEEVTQ